LSAGDLCQPSGPDDEGQARGQARKARGEPPHVDDGLRGYTDALTRWNASIRILMNNPDPLNTKELKMPASTEMDGAATGTSQQANPEQQSELAPSTEKLDLLYKIRQGHHNAIWEEQKHFTWLISIILSGQLVIFAGVKVASTQKITLVVISSLVGILFAVIGFRTQRIEGIYYSNVNVAYNEAYKALFPATAPSWHRGEPNKKIKKLISTIFTKSSGVRDYFQFLFLSFIVVFAATAVYACVAL